MSVDLLSYLKLENAVFYTVALLLSLESNIYIPLPPAFNSMIWTTYENHRMNAIWIIFSAHKNNTMSRTEHEKWAMNAAGVFGCYGDPRSLSSFHTTRHVLVFLKDGSKLLSSEIKQL